MVLDSVEGPSEAPAASSNSAALPLQSLHILSSHEHSRRLGSWSDDQGGHFYLSASMYSSCGHPHPQTLSENEIVSAVTGSHRSNMLHS